VSFHQCCRLIPLFFTKAIKRHKLPLSLNKTINGEKEVADTYQSNTLDRNRRVERKNEIPAPY